MRTGALAYFVLVLGWSTLWWGASARWGGDDPSSSPLFLLGGAGPFLAAVLLTQLREEPATRRDFWIRILDVRRLRGRWLAAALFLHPAIVGLAVLADVALGSRPPALATDLEGPMALLGLLFFVFWFGPLPEEIGWRGFALDRLQQRTSAVPASVVLGLVWAVWHLPLFFVPGTFQAELGPGSLRFWLFMAALVPLSILITWIYNNTNRSTLSAVLVHFSGNLCGALVAKTERVAALEVAFLFLVAGVTIASFGWRRLARAGG